MSIKSIEEGLKILKKHYDIQREVVIKDGVEEDILWVNMKYVHSQDVFKMSEKLIENEEILSKLNDEYKLYGKLGALLHDIGRAYEVGKTRKEAQPHGKYGADIILKNIENEENPFVLFSLKYHDDLYAEEKTRKDLEEINLSNDKKEIIIILLKLVMDSDKLANFKLFQSVDKKYFLSLSKKPYLTDICFDDFRNKKLVKREDRETVFDQLLSYITWVYDLNFEESKKLLLKNNFMNSFMDIFEKEINFFDTKENFVEILKLKEQLELIKEQLILDNLLI